MAGKSPWRDSASPPMFAPLTAPLTVDVAIIGGGLTGITAAYLLKDSGLSVAVLEAGTVGVGGSGATTAFLMELIDTDAQELVQTRDESTAKKILDSHRDAIAFYEHTAQKEGIDCEFMRCPLYKYARNSIDAAELKKEVLVLQKLGRKAVWKDDIGLPIKNQGYLYLDNQAKFHPLKYLFGLCTKLSPHISMYEHTKVESITKQGEHMLLMTPQGTVTATWVLMATHYPLRQPGMFYFKKAAYLTYVIEARIPQNILPEALYEDIENPYHYMRIDRGKEFDQLILGGADHRMDIPVPEENNFTVLKKYLSDILPTHDYTVVREWKGRIVEPGDGLALFGPIEMPRLFYATGHSGNGLTYAVIAAQLFKDFVLGRPNELQKLYAADRAFNIAAYLQSALHYLGEFFGGAVKNSF